MKSFLISVTLFITLFLPFAVTAQTTYGDVVYLKNGSIIHGTIIEQVPNESLKIQTKDQNIFVYRMEEVLKITKEEIDSSPNIREAPKSYRTETATAETIKKEGYTNITEINFARSLNSTSVDDDLVDDELANINQGLSVGIQTINGYQFMPYISAGLGIGIQAQSLFVLVPIFLDVHINFLAKRVTPFVSMAAGYSYTPREIFGFSNIGSNNTGGLMASPAAGVKFFVKPRFALNLSLGFRYQEIQLYHEDYYSNSVNYPEHTTNEILRHFNLRFGFTF